MRFNSLQQWLSWLESCHPCSEIELGLERIEQVAHRLQIGSVLPGKKVVTIAGTNGKGSCVAALNALLRCAGYHVGYYTSPHFLHYNERIVIDDKPVSDEYLVASFECVDQARASTELTYFEFGTLVALDVFQRCVLDVVILEVGLGGRLDAVNIIDSDIAIVTSIDLDHQDWLGTDRESIGKEKAGIFRQNKPAVCADPLPPHSIKAVADQLGATVFQYGQEFVIERLDEHTCQWCGVSANGGQVMVDLATPALSTGSVAGALQAIELLDMPITIADYACLERVQLPGRFQCVEDNSRGQVILDVAHNPAAAQHLVNKLQANAVKGQTLALIAMMKDKDCQGVIQALALCVDSWFIADLKEDKRAMAADDLAAIVTEHTANVRVSSSVEQAYQCARLLMGAEDRLIVLGSFVTVSAVMMILLGDNASGDCV